MVAEVMYAVKFPDELDLLDSAVDTNQRFRSLRIRVQEWLQMDAYAAHGVRAIVSNCIQAFKLHHAVSPNWEKRNE